MKTKFLPAIFILTLCFFTSQLNAQITYAEGRNHVYQTITEITATDPAPSGMGYITSNTIVSLPNSIGQLIRLDPAGNIIWSVILNGGSKDNITDVEKFISPITGQVEYLVIGNIVSGGNSIMYAARVDDNGNVLADRLYTNTSFSDLIGIRGIYSQATNSFIVVASGTNGISTSANKRGTVIRLDANTLAPAWTVILDSPTTSTIDYDMPTGVIETNPGRIVVFGTRNSTYPGGAAYAISYNIGAAAPNWQHEFSTVSGGSSHVNTIVDAIYDSGTNSVWLLGNTSGRRSFYLSNIDHGTGTFISSNLIIGVSPFDRYAYSLKRSVSTPSNFIIGGYQYNYGLNNAMPVLVEFNPGTSTIVWNRLYKTTNNGILTFAQNPLLFKRAVGRFGLYYNDMLSLRFDEAGYAFAGTENMSSSAYDNKIWGVDSGGNLSNPVCGSAPLTYSISNYNHFMITPQATGSGTTTILGTNTLTAIPYTPSVNPCGPIFKKGQTTSTQDLEEELQFALYPNPAHDVLNIKGNGIEKTTEVVIFDVQGKEVLRKSITRSTQSIAVDLLKSGLYIVKFMDNNSQILSIQKLRITK